MLFVFLYVLFLRRCVCSFSGDRGVLVSEYYSIASISYLPVSLYSVIVTWKGESSVRYFP